jgi:peptidoglycan/xylan/chitin deacetylase (PgdA/CDA1 family)
MTFRAKRAVKRLLGRILFAARLDALLLRNTAVVVVFHRVRGLRDDESDGMTISVPTFERYCRYFHRHFNVVPLGVLVDALRHGTTLRQQLAITFDDGYRDNYENAAPVLERLSLPATFFVVSQWMGSDVVPWWDRQNDVIHPWMTWDHVRSLHRRGFDIGAHTRTHADLGAIAPDDAKREIAGARQELEVRLKAPVELFAYPYGHKSNLTDTSRDLVRLAGFRCCCSCFGGIVQSGTDPFHLPRVPITPWLTTPQEFGFEIVARTSTVST